jgi:hypothetical protein
MIKFTLLLFFLHCSGMQGMEEEVFSTIDINSNSSCGENIIEGGSKSHPLSLRQDLETFEWQKGSNSSLCAILCGCFLVRRK